MPCRSKGGFLQGVSIMNRRVSCPARILATTLSAFLCLGLLPIAALAQTDFIHNGGFRGAPDQFMVFAGERQSDDLPGLDSSLGQRGHR